MKRWLPIIVCGIACWIGCAKQQIRTPSEPFTFNHYAAENFDWPAVKRILVMPMESANIPPATTAQLRAAMIAELQRDGRFDVVLAPSDYQLAKSHDVFGNGQFDEVELLYLSRKFQVQGILFGRVTQYHAYNPPRIGMSAMLVSPSQAVVIASLDGLWDGRDQGTAEEARKYYSQTQSWPNSLLGSDRVFQSPDVFQRFVCKDMVRSLRDLVDSQESAASSKAQQSANVMVPVGVLLPVSPDATGGVAPNNGVLPAPSNAQEQLDGMPGNRRLPKPGGRNGWSGSKSVTPRMDAPAPWKNLESPALTPPYPEGELLDAEQPPTKTPSVPKTIPPSALPEGREVSYPSTSSRPIPIPKPSWAAPK